MGNAINTRSGKIYDAMDAEEKLDYAQQQADQVKLSTYTLNDQIAYSTISIELYQDVTKYNEKVVRESQIDEYEPGFGSQALDALGNGWQGLSILFILLINIWPILILLTIAAIVYVRLKNKKKQ